MVLCPAMHMKGTVTSHAAWSDVQAKDQDEYQERVLHNLSMVRDSAADLAISLLLRLLSAASSYIANL